MFSSQMLWHCTSCAQVRAALEHSNAEAVAHFTPVLLDSAKRVAANPRSKLNSKWVQHTHAAIKVLVLFLVPIQ